MREVVLELKVVDQPITVAQLSNKDLVGVEFKDGRRGTPIALAENEWVIFAPTNLGNPKISGERLVNSTSVRALLLEIMAPKRMFKFDSRLELMNWLTKF